MNARIKTMRTMREVIDKAYELGMTDKEEWEFDIELATEVGIINDVGDVETLCRKFENCLKKEKEKNV